MTEERSSFTLHRRDRQGGLALLGARVSQYKDQINSIDAQIVAIDRQAKLIQPELEGARTLYAKRLVPLQRVNELERTAVQLQGSRAALVANIAEARGRITETQEQMLNIDKTRRSDAATELATVEAQLGEQQVRHASADDTLSRSVVRAPQSGTIDKLAYTTVGSAIPAGQPILQIVPDRDALIVEGQIKPDDIEQVRIGQQARVTFPGLDRQSTPDIVGTVTFISADLTRDQRTGAAYYRFKVRLDAQQMASAPQIVLKPGMPAQVFVKTGDRSILSFLLKPLFDQIRYAMRGG
jgi:HlyD family secretion protein